MKIAPPLSDRTSETAPSVRASRSERDGRSGVALPAYGFDHDRIDPGDYQFICRDIYGVRFFLNAQTSRGDGYFLSGAWADRTGTHGVCGIYHEKTRTVSLTLEYPDSRRIMSQYTYSGNNRFAGVECNHNRNSCYEMSLYLEKGAFPGLT